MDGDLLLFLQHFMDLSKEKSHRKGIWRREAAIAR
jgi:hypothetical protein